jgi:hypothetical protein
MQRTRSGRFGFYFRFGIQTLDFVRGQGAQRSVGGELDRRTRHPTTTALRGRIHLMTKGVDDKLTQAGAAFHCGDLCSSKDIVREV